MHRDAYHNELYFMPENSGTRDCDAEARSATRLSRESAWIADKHNTTAAAPVKQTLRLLPRTRTVRKDGWMKRYLRNLFHPTNRSVRVLVGLLLVCLLVIQVTQTVATPDSPQAAIRTTPEEQGGESDLVRLARTDHLKLLEACLAELDARHRTNYTCTFTKQERIRGQLGKPQRIAVKFREKPFSIAMHWQTNPPLGNALLYIEGQYKNDAGRAQMVVRPTSPLFQRLTGGSVKKLPDGPDAMRNTLRPCTAFGFRNSLQSLIDVYRQARDNDDCVEKFAGFADVDGRECVVLERLLPDRADYPAKKTQIFIDTELLLPVRVIGWDWNDKLSCDYRFTDLDFAADLDDTDFTPQANDITVK